MAQTLQEHYNSIKSGKGNKAQFLRQTREMFPQYFNQYSDFNTTVNVLKSKQIISEAAGGVVSKGFDIWDWKKILAEEVKAEEKETSKEVKDANKHAYDNADMKNADNINFNEIMKGFYAELKDAKNHDKTAEEIKAMVVKNLAKDCLYYTKDGEFGVKGLGYTTEAPGLGEPKEPKGKHKSSGYGDLDTDIKVEKVKANVQDSLGDREAKTSNPKKVKEMPDKGVTGVEKKMKLQESAPSEREAMMDGYLSVIETNNMSEDDAVAYLEDQGVDQNMINTIIKYAFPIKESKLRSISENESEEKKPFNIPKTFDRFSPAPEGSPEYELNYNKIEKEFISNLRKLGQKSKEWEYVTDAALENLELDWATGNYNKLYFLKQYFSGNWEKIAEYLMYEWYKESDDLSVLSLKEINKFNKDLKIIEKLKYNIQHDASVNENESVYQQLEDLQNELMSETDPERKKEIENKILSLEKSLSESKLRSIIKSIIKEELNK